MKIAILGGSGKLGKALAMRLAMTSHEVSIASRDPEKGMRHREAAAWCDLAVVAIPYSSHDVVLSSIKDELAGKIVIDATVPLDPQDPTRLHTMTGTSATEEAAAILTQSHVFGAMHTISHLVLRHVSVRHDVLIAGGLEGKDAVFDLMKSIALRPIHAGPLRVAGLLESLTPLLISINKQNGIRESGIQIEGLPET